MNRNEGQKPWGFRRKIIAATLLFCGFCVLWTMIFGAVDAETGRTIVASAFGLAGAVIGYYVAGAVWSDKEMKK